MHTATKKAFIGRSGLLVEEGDEDAFVLLACLGKEMKTEDVAGFANASDFFTGIEKKKPKAEEPKLEEPREDKRKQR